MTDTQRITDLETRIYNLETWMVAHHESHLRNATPDQLDIDSGKVDPWTPQRDYVAELNKERMAQISTDLISRVQRAMERGAIIMAVPFPDDGGSAENAETSSHPTPDMGTSNHPHTPCMNDRCLHWRYHHRNTGGACEVGICDCKAFV